MGRGLCGKPHPLPRHCCPSSPHTHPPAHDGAPATPLARQVQATPHRAPPGGSVSSQQQEDRRLASGGQRASRWLSGPSLDPSQTQRCLLKSRGPPWLGGGGVGGASLRRPVTSRLGGSAHWLRALCRHSREAWAPSSSGGCCLLALCDADFGSSWESGWRAAVAPTTLPRSGASGEAGQRQRQTVHSHSAQQRWAQPGGA